MRLSRPVASTANAGFSMIEVLIALVVVGIGVLSVIGLQLVSKGSNLDARQQGHAAQAAYDLIERLRANSNQSSLRQYLIGSSPSLGRSRLGLIRPTPGCSTSAPCTPLQLVAVDLWEWEQSIDGRFERIDTPTGTTATGGLIEPIACVQGPADGSSGIYTVSIAWRGTVALPANNTVTCGQGDAAFGAADEYRRTLSIQSYIITNG